MASMIAEKLIEEVIEDTLITDSIWRNSNLSNISKAFSFPSKKLTNELLTFLDGDKSYNFTRLIGGKDNLDLITNSKLTKQQVKGLCENKHISNAQLKIIGERNSNFKKLVEEEIEKREILHNELISGSMNFVEFGSIISSLPNEILLKYLDRDILKERNDILKSIYVVDKSRAVELALIIFGGKIEDYNGYVDTYIAKLLIENMNPEIDLRITTHEKNLKNRISKGAVIVLYNAGYDLFENKKKFTSTSNSKTTAETIKSLELLGESNMTIASMILSTDVDLTKDYFVKKISLAPVELISNFIKGATQRKPKKDEIHSIFKSLDSKKRDELLQSLGEFSNLENLPWASELSFTLPKAFSLISNSNLVSQVKDFLLENLEQRDSVWEFFLVVSDEWEDDLFSLVEASNNV